LLARPFSTNHSLNEAKVNYRTRRSAWQQNKKSSEPEQIITLARDWLGLPNLTPLVHVLGQTHQGYHQVQHQRISFSPMVGLSGLPVETGFRKQSAHCVQILTINLDVEGALLILKQPKASVAYFNQRSLSRHVKED
jgi:hypothetical protein